MIVTEDTQGWLDIRRQPSGLAFNPFHDLGRAHDHTPLPVIIDAIMSPQIHMEDALASPRTAKEKEKAPTPSFFNQAQWGVAPPPVPFVWDATNMNTQNAQRQSYGTERRLSYKGTSKGGSSSSTDSQFASISKPWGDVKTLHTRPDTSAQDAGCQGTVPSAVLRHRKTNPLTPYKPDTWHRQLERHDLLGRYPNLYLSLTKGFDVGVPSIQQTYIPPNSSLINKYPEIYEEIVETEFQKGRYLGPFSRVELESLIRPFQSSPLSLVTKPGKPGKYRMVHDFSHPRSPCTNPVESINSAINSHNFPCTWGTFSTICLIVYCLPPGSQASIWDVSEAYRMIPYPSRSMAGPGRATSRRGQLCSEHKQQLRPHLSRWGPWPPR